MGEDSVIISECQGRGEAYESGRLKKENLFSERVYFDRAKSVSIKEYFIALKGQTEENGAKK